MQWQSGDIPRCHPSLPFLPGKYAAGIQRARRVLDETDFGDIIPSCAVWCMRPKIPELGSAARSDIADTCPACQYELHG